MDRQKIMLFNGFLGSGKTTTMVATAKYLAEKGIRVSLITNDLGENLVDTNYARLNGVPVREIPNGCLCHDVPNFLTVLRETVQEDRPDYIFAEPVGSCVGLVESVYRKLYEICEEEFELCPFVAVVDPLRYRSIYMESGKNTFNDEATYMYGKQLSDADLILLNKCDLISGSEELEIRESLHANFPDAKVIAVISASGGNYAEWTDSFTQGQKSALHDSLVDWDYLLQGDEHMGWFNSTLRFFAEKEMDFNLVAENLMNEARYRFLSDELEIAHLKILGRTEKEFCRAALTGAERPVTFSDKLQEKAFTALFLINCRAIAPPEKIAEIMNAAVESTRNLFGLRISEEKEQAFNSFKSAPEPKEICHSCGCGCDC